MAGRDRGVSRLDHLCNRLYTYRIGLVRLSDYSSCPLTLETVGVEQILALFVAFDSAFGAADALASDAPE